MDNVLNFLKSPFSYINLSMFLFWMGVAVALIFLIVLFGVTGTKRKIKKNRRIIEALNEKIGKQEKAIEAQKVMLDTLADKLNESNEKLNIVLRNTNETMNRVFDSDKMLRR